MKKIILCSIVICLFFITGCENKKTISEDQFLSKAFFLKNDEGRYALFDKNGKKLTGFDFKYVDDFSGGGAIVTNDDMDDALINENGKFIIPFGKYESLSGQNGIYKVADENYKSSIIDINGKVLADGENISVSYFNGSSYTLLTNKQNNTIDVLNPAGSKIFSMPYNDDAISAEESALEGNFFTITYNKKSYVIDFFKSKKVAEFDSEKGLCPLEARNNNEVILTDCQSITGSDQNKLVYIKDEKTIYDGENICYKLVFDKEGIKCTKEEDKKTYFFDTSFKEVGMYINNDSYIDYKTAVKKSDSNKYGVDFYKDNKVVKTIDCRYIATGANNGKNGVYILKTSSYGNSACTDKTGIFELYDSDGNKISEQFANIGAFDNNNLAIVTTENKKSFTIDSKGNKISKEYDSVKVVSSNDKEKYYEGKNSDDVTIFDKEGKEIITGKYSYIFSQIINNNVYFKATTNDKKYVVMSAKDKKEILISDGNISIELNYIKAYGNNKTIYYTYNGKEFHSTTK